MATSSSFESDTSGAYEAELFGLFSNSGFMDQVKERALNGSLQNIRFRSICWKLFLDVLPPDRHVWVEVTRDLRNQYDELLEKYYIDPRSDCLDDVSINNPLSTSDLSSWNIHFEHKQLKQLIHQDVIRTFPDNEFFHSEEIQAMMTNILFVFACEQPSLKYKQGMHELLAPILLVIQKDVDSYFKACALDGSRNLEMEVHIMLNPNYIEHDAYFMFCQTMVRVEPWYMDNSFDEQADEINPVPNKFPTESLPNTMQYIWFKQFKSYDPELYTHLTKLEISPQMFGIRWLRLLFGREFVMDDLLAVWDAIFADNIEFNLYQYIFSSMLISIRHLLLRGNYTTCLNHLMHFPTAESVQFIIDLSLYLRNPQDYKRPETHKKSRTLIEGKENKPTSRKSFYGSTGLGRAESLLKKSFESRPKSLSVTSRATGMEKLWRGPEKAAKYHSPRSQSSVEPKSTEPDSTDSSKSFILSSSDRSSIPYIPSEKGRSESETSYSLKTPSTLPRSHIRNVMEGQSHQFRASDFTQSPGVDDDKNQTEKPYQEMVEIISTITSTPKVVQEIPIEIARQIQSLLDEVKRLKDKNAYCTRKMTQHLDQLREVVMSPERKDVNLAISAMDGLELVRIILDEKIQFTPDSLREVSEESLEVLSNEASELTLESEPDINPSAKKPTVIDFKIYRDTSESD